MTIQDAIFSLKDYFRKQGCLIGEPLDMEVGAGTMHPYTFFAVLGPKPWKAAYVQPSRRPADGRYGDSPYRYYIHYQFQVIMKPAPADIQDIYLEGLKVLGIDYEKHDMRFIEDNWESPTLGAAGVGWEVWMDGQEVSQFTYFQQCGGVTLNPPSVELTFGIERLCMYSEGIENGFNLKWNPENTYGDLRKRAEYELCKWGFEFADIDVLKRMMDDYEKESNRAIEAKLAIPAYEYALKCSHTFNLLDARGALSVSERAGMIARVRDLTRKCASVYQEVQYE